jgi:hypothetical protein
MISRRTGDARPNESVKVLTAQKKIGKKKGQKPVSAQRGEFGSRFGFIMAAAGSAVGLGNIWGFPTQAASNGGAAFVLVYLVLAFLLAYPVLMAELTLGRHAHGNMIAALAKVSRNGTQRGIGTMVGIVGIFTGKPYSELLCNRIRVDARFWCRLPPRGDGCLRHLSVAYYLRRIT